jgi:adenylate cyclase
VSSIRCLPDDVLVDSDGALDLLSALLRADVPIAHDCGGKARCSTCRVRIIDGQDGLSVRSTKERVIADRLELPAEIRLACQTYAERPVTLLRLVLDELDEVLADQTHRKKAVGAVGREVDIAVVLADVVGYTALSDALPAYDIMHILNRFFRSASRGIERHGGRVDNYMGDAVLAFFGLDETHDASRRAVQASFEILKAAASVSDYVSQLYDRSFSVRVGVHYGRVVVGSVGGEGTARETAIGEAVNIASRLETANKEFGTDILVSAEVMRQCTDALVVGRQFQLELRGIAGDIEVFEPISIQ